jgi:hypothetical protein
MSNRRDLGIGGLAQVLFGSSAGLSIAIVTSALAGFLRGTTGFGSSLVLAPILSAILGPADAVAITLLIGASASVLLIPRYLSDIDRASVLPLSLAGAASLLPGVLSLNLVPSQTMRHVIAWVMIAITLLMLIPRFSFRRSLWQSATAGALSGLIMGATSMGGPPLVLYFSGRRDDPRQLKANIVIAVGLLEIGALAILAAMGRIDLTVLLRLLILLPVFLLVTHFAERAVGHNVGRRYQHAIFGLLLATGLVAAFS